MTESNVQVNTPATAGKKLKTFESTDGNANVVQSQASVLVDATTAAPIALLTDTQLRASPLPLPTGASTEATVSKRFSGGKTSGATLITATGDNDVKIPAVGKRLTLYWIFLSASQDNAGEVLATVKLGTRVIYKAYLGNPGAFAHWEPEVADAVNDKLIVNLSAAANVAVSFTTTEA